MTTTNPQTMASSSRQDYSHRLRQRTGRSNPNNIYTDGSKSEQGVGAGIAIIIPGTPTIKLMYRMDTRCTNNQAEVFAILKVLEYITN